MQLALIAVVAAVAHAREDEANKADRVDEAQRLGPVVAGKLPPTRKSPLERLVDIAPPPPAVQQSPSLPLEKSLPQGKPLPQEKSVPQEQSQSPSKSQAHEKSQPEVQPPASTQATFYTDDNGYRVRIMASGSYEKAVAAKGPAKKQDAPAKRKLDDKPAAGPKVEPKPADNVPKRDAEEPEEEPPAPPPPVRTTMTVPNNVNNKPQPTNNKKPIGKPSKKKGDDEEGGEDAEGPATSTKRNGAAPTAQPGAPQRTSDGWGDYVLPTRASKPRWLSNAATASAKVECLLLVATLAVLLFGLTI